ncbi:hypothetical protein MO973_20365 [Paenibacillus sp. TRM 82003]|nr:hypothetical protein [Paenibacillus sp. TRM 82003]
MRSLTPILIGMITACLIVPVGGCSRESTQEPPPPSAAPPAALSFSAVNNEQKVALAEPIDYDDVVLERPVWDGRVVVYARPDDPERLYADFLASGTRYELGVVGDKVPQAQGDDELLSVDTLTGFGRTLVRIKGILGANAPIQNYFIVENGAAAPFLRVDTGHAREIDLDGDGASEIVSTHGTPMRTYLYRFDDGGFAVADVNAALGADSVHLNESASGVFLASRIGADEQRAYRFEAGRLYPLESSAQSREKQRPEILILPMVMRTIGADWEKI